MILQHWMRRSDGHSIQLIDPSEYTQNHFLHLGFFMVREEVRPDEGLLYEMKKMDEDFAAKKPKRTLTEMANIFYPERTAPKPKRASEVTCQAGRYYFTDHEKETVEELSDNDQRVVAFITKKEKEIADNTERKDLAAAANREAKTNAALLKQGCPPPFDVTGLKWKLVLA